MKVNTVVTVLVQTVLILASFNKAWADAAATLAHGAGLPVDIVEIHDTAAVRDTEGTWRCLRGVSSDGAILVRPDQHVAWRGNDSPADPATLIDTVRGAMSGAVRGRQNAN